MITKGFMIFRLGPAGLESNTVTVDEIAADFANTADSNTLENLMDVVMTNRLTVQEYSLMSGSRFLSLVDNTCIMDDDGMISEVIVDGFVSNLGLSHKDFSQGEFLVTYDVWKYICSNHDVVVNWANK